MHPLLKAILIDPADDTVRLAYADYLDEVGGEADRARAEFIRVSVAMSQCGPPHKQPVYPEIAMPLTSHGDRHWSFTGYFNEGLKINDRIDILVHRGLRKHKMVRGFRVYKIDPISDYPDEVRVFVRLDADSGPWKGTPYRKRSRELLKEWAGTWSPMPDAMLTWNRGFVEGVNCTMAGYEEWGKELFSKHPVVGVQISDRSPEVHAESSSTSPHVVWYDGDRPTLPSRLIPHSVPHPQFVIMSHLVGPVADTHLRVGTDKDAVLLLSAASVVLGQHRAGIDTALVSG